MQTELFDVPTNIGPAMRALNKRQRAYVVVCLETGSANQKRNAQLAGYTGNDSALAVQGWRLAHDPKVLAAMEEEAHRRLRSGALMATSRLIHLAENAREEKDQLKAIDMILNRTGFHAKTEHKIDVTHEHRGPAEIQARIKELAERLGVDPVKLLGHSRPAETAAPVIEAEFVEVQPETEEGEIQW